MRSLKPTSCNEPYDCVTCKGNNIRKDALTFAHSSRTLSFNDVIVTFSDNYISIIRAQSWV